MIRTLIGIAVSVCSDKILKTFAARYSFKHWKNMWTEKMENGHS